KPDLGRMLNVGCGAGIFARAAFKEGWSVCGVDPAATPEADQEDGRSLTLIQGLLDAVPSGQTFDVITLWDVVEHLERPRDLLSACKDYLAPGGWLVMETGNFLSTGRIVEDANWWCYQHDHRWYFSPKTLESLLRDIGFSDF